MKKFLAVLCVIAVLFSFAACSNPLADNNTNQENNANVSDTVDVDMSKYPENLDDWSGQNFIDYFTEVGLFRDGNGYETWLQDHATYWPGTPVDECAGWWDDAEMVTVMIFTLDGTNADTSEEELEEWKAYITENKALNEEYMALPIDHLVGNVAFSYESMTLDDDVLAQIDSAYNTLIETMGVTPEF